MTEQDKFKTIILSLTKLEKCYTDKINTIKLEMIAKQLMSHELADLKVALGKYFTYEEYSLNMAKLNKYLEPDADDEAEQIIHGIFNANLNWAYKPVESLVFVNDKFGLTAYETTKSYISKLKTLNIDEKKWFIKEWCSLYKNYKKNGVQPKFLGGMHKDIKKLMEEKEND